MIVYSIPFGNEYYFVISLVGDLRRLLPRARCQAKNEIQNIIFKQQMSANSFGESSKTSFNNSHSNGTVQPFNYNLPLSPTAQKMKFSIKYFFIKCDQIRSVLRIWSHLLKKSLMENFSFCAVPSRPLQIPVKARIIKTKSQEELK